MSGCGTLLGRSMGGCVLLPCSPTEMFQNRLQVDSIELRQAAKLDANHMVVVYKQLDGKIDRRIVSGPTIFIPTAHEW